VGYEQDGMVTPQEQARRDRMRRGMEAQLKDLMQASAPPRGTARVQFESAQPQGQASPGQAAGPPAGTAGAAGAAGASGGARPAAGTATNAPALVDALEIYAAQTLTPVDTYQTGYISARIVAGKLAGAFLVGRTQMVNEGLQPRFTQMRWNNRTYAIDAIALDDRSGTDAVRANLDRRYMQRYVMPVVVAMVGGYTAAKAQTGSTTVEIGAGGTGSTGLAQPAPTEEQAINAGVSRAMGMTQRAVDQEAALPIRASLPAGTAIGVMFNAPVADLDATRDAVQEAARSANAARQQTLPAAAQAGAGLISRQEPRLDPYGRPMGAAGPMQTTPGFGMGAAAPYPGPYNAPGSPAVPYPYVPSAAGGTAP